MKEWKVQIPALVIVILACIIVDINLKGYSREVKGQAGNTYVSCIGEITQIDAGRATGQPTAWTWSVGGQEGGQILTIEILSGRFKGQNVFAANTFIGEYSDRVFRVGDKIYITLEAKDDSIVRTSPVGLGEYVRTSFLLYLAAAFLILIIIIGGSKGIKAGLSLIASGVFIAGLLIPMFLRGYNPVLVSILIATVNSVLTFMLVGGMTRKSVAGILGTVGGLATAAILAAFSSYLLKFSGLDISFGFLNLGKRLWLAGESSNWDFRGILVAGMIIGASGAIMDSSMAVASAIDEVKKANPQIGIRGCIKAGLNVGKDEMGTMANTLIFAYIGADITLILMPMIQFGEAGQAFPFTRVVNQEAASAEIVQAMAGTIGLIMAIPITALFAGILIGKSHGEIDEADSKFTGKPIFRWIVPIIMLVTAIGIQVGYSVTRRSAATQTDRAEERIVSEYVRAKVIDRTSSIDVPSDSGYAKGPAKSEILRVKIKGGNYRNDQTLVQNIIDPNRIPLNNVEVNNGDEVLLKVDGTKQSLYEAIMHNYSRDGILLYIIGLFIILMILVGRFQGIRTIIALTISLTIILEILLPLIMKGYDPVLSVIVISGFVAFTSLIIITGFNRKTGSATIGIMGGVITAGLLVLFADQRLHFTGISSSRAALAVQFTTSQNLDFRKILMAGIIMGLLGTAMDAAIAVASSVREVRNANPDLPAAKLVRAGMNVGTDVLGTMANTLIFAYVGLRLMLIMTLAGTNILAGGKLEILSTETVAAEILRLLAGSIGLVLTIPITAFAAAWWDEIMSVLGFGGKTT
ncbi:hypothetical protein GF312_21930 [Candidatus Poribacteria bacterium]|nr:hypothetical protein [Candidatus Poribacteria bacterium]